MKRDVVKRELIHKRKTRVVVALKRSCIQAGLGLRNRVRSLAIWREVGEELLLLHVERSQLR